MMRTFFLVIIFITTAEFGYAQYIIPGASQQPAWVFPIFLEEGNGGRDTLYIGFDSTASTYGLQPSDSIFGVKVTNIDTTVFNSTWAISLGWPGNLTDTAYKVLVTSAIPFPFQSAGTISFMNASYPLKVSWDVNLLRSDSLPFADQGASPSAQCELSFDMPFFGDAYINGNQLYCGFAPLLISDQVQPWVTTCLAKDSVSFKDAFNTIGALPNYLIPSFKSWTGEVVSINNLEISDGLKLYPNPTSSVCTLKFDKKIDDNLTFCMSDFMGSIVSAEIAVDESEIKLNVSNFNAGIYFLIIKSTNQYRRCKLIILKN